MAIGAALSAVGLMHSFEFTGADTVLRLQPAWRYVGAYLAAAAILVAARWLTVPLPSADEKR